MRRLASYLTIRRKDSNDQLFLELYSQYSERIKQFILRYVTVESVAEDLAQDVFTKIYESPGLHKEVRNWKSFLFKVAKNYTLDYLKRNSRNVDYLAKVLGEFDERDSCLDRQILEKEYFEFLEKCLHRLPEKSRIIFGLCRQEEYSYDEVAKQLGISKHTVKYHMVYSMKTIRKEIEGQFNISMNHIATFLVFIAAYLF